MKRDQKFAFTNSLSHRWFDLVERLKIEILIRKRIRMLDFFSMPFCYDIKLLISCPEEFWREVPKFEVYSK